MRDDTKDMTHSEVEPLTATEIDVIQAGWDAMAARAKFTLYDDTDERDYDGYPM